MLFLADQFELVMKSEVENEDGDVVEKVERLLVYGDFNDPTRFYYLPATPKISVFEDGTPALKLFVFREDFDELEDDDEEVVGFLALDCDVAHPPELIERAKRQLRSERELEEEPRLAPIPYRDGKVRFVLLDAQTGEDDEEPEPEETEFVAKTLTLGKPSLFGDNRVVFQAELTKKGARAMAGVLSADPDGVTPLAVIYELTFAGLQPAYNIRVTADWSKVYDHFSSRDSFIMPFGLAREEIDNITDELVESRVIEIASTIEGVDEEGMVSSHDQALDMLRQHIFESFFVSGLDRAESAGRALSDGYEEGARATLGGPLSALLGRDAYFQKDVQTIEQRTLDVDWTVRKAVQRTIYPQAHLRAFAAGQRIERDDVVVVVDAFDALGEHQELVITARTTPWVDDGIAAVAAEVRYGVPGEDPEQDWSVMLTPEAPEVRKKGWIDGDDEGMEVQYRYTATFDTTIKGPSMQVDSGWITADGRILTIQPRNLYEVYHLEVSPVPDYPFERYVLVHVALRYTSADGTFTFHHDGVLKPDARLYLPSFRVPKAAAGAKLEMRVVHQRADGVPVEQDWTEITHDHIVIPDPDVPRSIMVIPAIHPAETQVLVVALQHKENGIVTDATTLNFHDATLMVPQHWKYYPEVPDDVRYEYQVTLVKKNTGEAVVSGWVETDATVLAVGYPLLHTLLVDVSLDGLDEEVQRVEVTLEHDRVMPDGTLQTTQADFTLVEDGQRLPWRVPMGTPFERGYRYTVRWVRVDGFVPTMGPVMSTERFLEISGTPPAT